MGCVDSDNGGRQVPPIGGTIRHEHHVISPAWSVNHRSLAGAPASLCRSEFSPLPFQGFVGARWAGNVGRLPDIVHIIVQKPQPSDERVPVVAAHVIDGAMEPEGLTGPSSALPEMRQSPVPAPSGRKTKRDRVMAACQRCQRRKQKVSVRSCTKTAQRDG